MCMKGTRSTQILATVFHNHKYITNPDIRPKERVITATVKLVDALKGRMTPHLSETTLEKLDRIGTILNHEQKKTVQTNPPMITPIPLHPPH